MSDFNPYLESCKISTDHMSRLAMKERDINFIRFSNCFKYQQSHDISKCNGESEGEKVVEERFLQQNNLLKGSKITNKNCHYIPFRSSTDEWVNQFPTSLNFGDEIFNIQSKKR